ncbi:LysR substrate-binding domain-containing protein [Nisaea sp.]|uniref:LysR family transcriptional regulator n=1 Tax=Nisaea sp. TaxID=2024842 RepID=UPI003299C55B
MQHQSRISLNAIRVFAAVVRHRAITGAAEELHVTPSAVSHQLRKLELEIGLPLFERGNNSITPTAQGERLFRGAAGAIEEIDRAVAALTRDAWQVVVRAPLSFAIRWLIPALERFKANHPETQVRVETSHHNRFRLEYGIDLAITYHRIDDPTPEAELLLRDDCVPVASPGLLRSVDGEENSLALIPALQCSTDNWDWKLWSNAVGLRFDELILADGFDIDDAALHGAVAGYGMTLAPAAMIARELRYGTLVPIRGYRPVSMGGYYVQTHKDNSKAVRDFIRWLMAEVKDTPEPT